MQKAVTLILITLLSLSSEGWVSVYARGGADIAPEVSASFDLPQETTTCAADDQPYSGFSYDSCNLGMSFKKWNQLQGEKGRSNNINKVSKGKDIGAASYRISSLPQELWGNVWNPLYLFTEDQGCYRLTMIEGEFSDEGALRIMTHLKDEQGKEERDPNTGSFTWTSKDGTTRIMVLPKRDYTMHLSFYDRALFMRWLSRELKKNK